jgi:hypothetical protein
MDYWTKKKNNNEIAMASMVCMLPWLREKLLTRAVESVRAFIGLAIERILSSLPVFRDGHRYVTAGAPKRPAGGVFRFWL